MHLRCAVHGVHVTGYQLAVGEELILSILVYNTRGEVLKCTGRNNYGSHIHQAQDLLRSSDMPHVSLGGEVPRRAGWISGRGTSQTQT